VVQGLEPNRLKHWMEWRFLSTIMHATLARRALGNIVPPKIATPSSVSGGSAQALAPLVEFYSKLPKGPAPKHGRKGPFAWFSNAKNSSARPILYVLGGLTLFGYTLDYNMHLKHHKNHPH